VVGAGRAGISATLQAKKLGLKTLTLEQDSLGGTVYTFPRKKIVMTAPMDLPLHGKLKLYETSKQELLDLWNDILGKNSIEIHENKKVDSITIENGGFRVIVKDGTQYSANKVLLAIGRRGTPRKLNIPGEISTKVAYRLLEPELITGKNIVVVGGETRYQSVRNGLNALGDTDIVAVHDGVRPLVSQATITNCFDQAAKTGAAIPVLPVVETLRTGTMEHSKTVDRSFFFSVQTPQVFHTSLLKKAYAQNWNDAFTDDASVVEKQGIPIMMVPGNRENIKITHPGDLLLAKEYLKKNDPF
jgi:2-C-methyl-D-erythritol 4-phosphate cytidylyltransferase